MTVMAVVQVQVQMCCVCVYVCMFGGGGGACMRARYADCILLVPHRRIIIILAETVKHLPKTNPVM